MVSKGVAGVVVGGGFRGRQVVAFVVARGWLSWSSEGGFRGRQGVAVVVVGG